MKEPEVAREIKGNCTKQHPTKQTKVIRKQERKTNHQTNPVVLCWEKKKKVLGPTESRGK